MTVKSLLTGVLSAMLCVSCGENQSAGGQSRGKGELRIPDAPIVRAPAGANTAAAAAPVSPAADLSDMPLAPKDSQWTIYCASVRDPAHVETSRALKAELVKRTGMRSWYLLHESQESRLYYGFYSSLNDKNAQADRKKIDATVDGGGERPFRACQFVRLNAPDPDAPPEWNIANAPSDKAWTLIIGGYKDSPERKRAAVDAVRAARAAGEEAYYLHGDNISNVCIGAWSGEALSEVRDDPDPAARRNGSGDIFVLPPGVKAPAKMRDKSGKPLSPVGQSFVPVDPTLKKKIAQYPEMAMNGETMIIKSGKTVTVQRSVVFPIPRSGDTLFGDNVAAAAAAAEQNADGRGLDPQDPFSRPGYQDTSASKSAPRPAANDGTAGGLRSIGQR